VESSDDTSATTQASLMPSASDSIPAAERSPAATDSLAGELITCGEQVVGEGDGTVHLMIALPKGYELSDAAPLHVALVSENEEVVVGRGQRTDWTFDAPAFPVKLPVRFSTGQTAVRLGIAAYYCESGRKYLCQMARLHALVPVSVSPHVSSHVIRLDVPVPVAAP
jgi:hypothetical protein